MRLIVLTETPDSHGDGADGSGSSADPMAGVEGSGECNEEAPGGSLEIRLDPYHDERPEDPMSE